MADNRTPGGEPNQKAYEKYGNKRGAFPIFDEKSARAALRLRGHAQSKAERANIINRAAKYIPDDAKAAREIDKKSGDL